MNNETSTYLDGMRFLAACTVLLCHVDEYLVKNQIPFVQHLGIEAVGIFFVLSGFVIGYATNMRETDLKTYSINRFARLYSVVIPCFIITFVLDLTGKHFIHANYIGSASDSRALKEILFSLTFLNYSWLLPHVVLPGSDGPFWSLCFEVPYYILFGAAYFLRGFWRVLVPITGGLCFGPNILELFPIWLLGLGVYWLCRGKNFGQRAGRVVFALAVLFWILFEAILWALDICPNVDADIQAGNLLMVGSGSIFALSIIGFSFAGIRISAYAAPIRWLAGATFTIYLLHFPVACFLNALVPAGWPAPLRWTVVVPLTLCAAFITAAFAERRKHVWRRNIEHIFDTIQKLIFPSDFWLRPSHIPSMKETRDDKNSL